MWVLFSLGSAIIYTAQWAVVRASHQKIPSSMMTMSQNILGLALASGVFIHPMPLERGIVLAYLFYVFVINPPFSWFATYAIQRMPVSMSQPLSSLAVVSSTFVGWFVFRTEFSVQGIAGIILGFTGLWMLYHARWSEWRKAHPWILAACIMNFGVVSAISGQVLAVYPHPVILSGVGLSATLTVSVAGSVVQRRKLHVSKQTIVMLIFLSLSGIISESLQLTALGMAPAAYVISVKRVSIVLTAMLGYGVFRERQIPFARLMTASIVVLAGLAFIAAG